MPGHPGRGEAHRFHRGFGGSDGFAGRAGRVFAPGDLRLIILSLLEQRPAYGYEVIKSIEQEFGGAYTPSPGSVYPTLSLLEETGLADAEPGEGGRRRYALSTAGCALLDSQRAAVNGARGRMQLAARSLAGRRPPETVIQAMQTLKAALALHGGDWTDAEARRVSRLIEQAAREIAQPRE
jgi:DNA-binding PadR family transcriptional regulator